MGCLTAVSVSSVMAHPGAQRAGGRWIIPEDAEKPTDARIKSGKYVKPKVKE